MHRKDPRKMKTTAILALLLFPTFLGADPLASGQWGLAAADGNPIEELRTVTFVRDDTGSWSVSLTMHDLSFSVPLAVTAHPKEKGREYVSGCSTKAWTTNSSQGVSTLLFRATFDADAPTSGYLHLFTKRSEPSTLAIRLRPLPEISNDQAAKPTKAEQDRDEILIAKMWLDQLQNEKGNLSEVLVYMSSEFNFDGQISSGKDQIQKRLLEMRKAIASPSITVKFSDFQRLDRIRIGQLMTNSKHSRKYKLSRDVIDSMVLFHLHTRWKGEENIDGVFLGFDSNKKIVSMFD